MTLLILLLVLFETKHFVADYLLQSQYMLGKSKPFPQFILPLAFHSYIHAILSYLIVFLTLFDTKLALAIAAIDFITHFIIDRIKADPNLLGRYDPTQRNFWWSLGFDQYLHHLIHIYFVYAILT